MNFLELYWTDSYKTGHKSMLPEGSILMYSNLTPRSGHLSNVPDSKGVVSFGQQMLVRKMKEDWDINFFNRPISEIYQFGKDMTMMHGLDKPYDVNHLVCLHKLGYLPIKIKAIKEGTFVPYKIPLLTIVNTKIVGDIAFDFLVNYLETILSSETWMPVTAATTGLAFRKLSHKWIKKTDADNLAFVDYQNHNFSTRGMPGKSAIVGAALGFATASKGSDAIAAIPAARKFYDEPLNETCISSVLATEHAIMCTLTGFFLLKKNGSWEKIGELELETFRYLLKLYPKGILSIVADTWNLWRVITKYSVILKKEILSRDGKVVFRPDSGNPVDIICGLNSLFSLSNLPFLEEKEYQKKHIYFGVIELLWDIFGGTISKEGYKVLNSHVGCIYGDSITLDKAEQIFTRLAIKGFAATNIVFGVGSYTLQYVTRDTHGIAQKATYVEIEYKGKVHSVDLFKDPITDSGLKKSAKGLLQVYKDNEGSLCLKDECTSEEESKGELKVIFCNGLLYNNTTLTKIRERVNKLI